MNKLKIVHCANFSYFKNGEVFYSTDRKITFGLMSQGHFVYDFSYRDQSKAQRFLAFKKKSIIKMNQDLIETCINIEPDLLLLAKSEFIFPVTLEKIKKILPSIKIAKWFVDFLDRENKTFFEQFNYIDFFFQTNATSLKKLSSTYPHMTCAFMPNIADPSFERKINLNKEYDLIYIARDHKEDVRYEFAVKLNDFCKKKDYNLKIYASLGNPLVFGTEYYREISKSKIAINFNRSDFLDRINEDNFMGSSDRMNHFMGMHTCTFSPRIRGLEDIYRDKVDVVYFDNLDDCFEKIDFYLKNKKYEEIAINGNKRVYEVSNANRVTKFMLEVIFNEKFADEYEWKSLVYKSNI